MDDQSTDKSVSLDKRLSLLENQIAPGHGKEAKVPSGKETGSSFGLAFRVASDMIAGILVGVGIGYGLDKWTGHRGLFLVVFALLGFGAGMRNVWRIAGAPVQDEQDKKNGRSPRG
ncbi:AtpZ/AtpI family protein [Acetobacteraceae bacterium ESL0709]|nr:AtpZ/AtpI family protein [Acetobacteraceae bacterium ESL0697]MDF7677185.1 AtpZ/AtpI family protein [Acetobacteraceae bacterium ESL0709]